MNSNNESKNFALSGRGYEGYRWFKPLLVILLTAAFYGFLLGAVLVIAMLTGLMSGINPGEILSGQSTGYDDIDFYTPVGAILNIGAVAVLLPALFFATKIIRYRPFGSYQSVTGKWRMRRFLIYSAAGLIFVAIPLIINSLVNGDITGEIHFTIAGFVLCIFLGICQCMAEEHIFRGLLMQAFGSWTKIAIVAIILQAVPFAIIHPYNITGRISVLLSGILMGVMACISGGLEELSRSYPREDFQLIGICADVFERGGSEINQQQIEKGKELMENAKVTFPNVIPTPEMYDFLRAKVEMHARILRSAGYAPRLART